MSKFELVSGLETHVELSTKTKIFCSCTTQFGSDPNTHCCPICIGLPGTMPKLNRQAVRYAVMAGLATNCTINNISKMDRKNYVYPDLPKAYQISQYDKPLCSNGYIQLDSGKKIRILRIHIEEDAGKLVHERGNTYVDYNRGGVPLIEIVTEPDIRSIDEAIEYVEKLQLIMKYIGVSDVKMQEGSLRCDVNISVRPEGDEKFGTRTEIKNMNSFTFIQKAMEYEYERQCDLVESGEKVVQETLRFNTEMGVTESMRGKEDAHDYRYFREPDLVTISITDEEIDEIRKSLPELPDAKRARYTEEYGISATDAAIISKYRRVAEFFDKAAAGVKNKKSVSNYIISQIFRRLSTEEAKEAFDISITADMLAELIGLVEGGKINNNLAKSTLEKMMDSGKRATELIDEKDMGGVDEGELYKICEEVIAGNAAAVNDYNNGKEAAFKSLIGGVMKATRGKADALRAQEILKEIIAK
ncbi:MAG: Asp-tRNA(Asn)/Glu-tRNA(Gln) amidotransferase subunit GatB [Clostridia bacterium]|nr:Asp-tRNA(Asn)/Glu-tRNA(Gln) amidotransferase subunit GatB [Clostridia bacterium]MEE1024959.1 Asp-tRNA(Asn)/Glu-tRNA(Gln) amidotransferase subunit GatB [Acutalibacteraceae bacterium]